MLLTMLLVSAVGTSGGGGSASVVLTESTQALSKVTTVQQGFNGTLSESSTAVTSKWRMEASVPFSSDQWAKLGQDGMLSVKIGKAMLEEKISGVPGFDPKGHSFSFKISRPAGATGVEWKYLKLPTDQPVGPTPPAGTVVVYAAGSLELKGSRLKITLWNVGNGAPSLAGENYIGVSEGAFEGKLPVEVKIGDQVAASDLSISGSLKRKDISDQDKGITGNLVQVSISGKS